MPYININTDEIVSFAHKLEQMGRSSLPNAVRNTLNDAGFSMKGVSGKEGLIQQFGRKTFKHERIKNFLSFMSAVNKAVGFEISKMESKAGIANYPNKNKIAEGLETQEEGGTMENPRPMIPLMQSRKNKNINSTVANKNRQRAIQGIIKVSGTGDKKALMIAARYKYFDGSQDKFIIYTKNRTTLFQVKKVTRNSVELIPLYRYQKGFKPKVGKHSFVSPAALSAAAGLTRSFVKAAEFEFNKIPK
jgi:hypothetical protein